MRRYELRKLTIAVATMAPSLEVTIAKINNYLEKDFFRRHIHFLVVSQSELLESIEQPSLSLTVIKSSEKGLSRSRNKAINNVLTEWVWFQDDDFLFNDEGVSELLLCLTRCNSELFFVQVNSLEDKNRPYKDYRFFNRHRRLNALKLSSIQILADVGFLRRNNLCFDSSLGLGTDLPCCEENLFLWKCFSFARDITYSNVVACYHTTEYEVRGKVPEKDYLAKGYFLRALPLYLGILLLLRWALRRGPVSRLVRFKALSRGFLKLF